MSTRLLIGVIAATLVSSCSQSTANSKPNFVTKDPPRPGILAKIGGEEITEEMLIGDGDARSAWMEIKKNEHDFRMRRLKEVVKDKLIGAEAKKANLPLDEFIKKNVTKGEIKISDADYNKFVKEKQIPESQINDQIKVRIQDFLKQQKQDEKVQAYIARLTRGNPVEVYFSKPKHVVKVDPGKGPNSGSKDAKVQIVEFSDFECPFCSRGADVVSELKKRYGKKINVTFRHFPLSFHQNARPASEASMCVNEQSGDKFWKFHDLLFKNQKALKASDLEGYAKQVGADMKKFKECFDGKKFAQAVQDDMSYGESIGVKSTPTFFVNGEMVAGALPVEEFVEMIDEALAAK
jgi:protein-disulfide isomerase